MLLGLVQLLNCATESDQRVSTHKHVVGMRVSDITVAAVRDCRRYAGRPFRAVIDRRCSFSELSQQLRSGGNKFVVGIDSMSLVSGCEFCHKTDPTILSKLSLTSAPGSFKQLLGFSHDDVRGSTMKSSNAEIV